MFDLYIDQISKGYYNNDMENIKYEIYNVWCLEK